MHGEPRTFCRTGDTLAYAYMSYFSAINCSHFISADPVLAPVPPSTLLLYRLSFFPQNLLARVSNPLTLVRFWRVKRPDIGSHLTNNLLVDSLDQKLCIFLDRNLDPIRNLKNHRMRKPDVQVQVLSLNLRPKSNAMDFECLLKALADTEYHIADQTPRKAMKCLNASRFGLPIQQGLFALNPNLDLAGQNPFQSALRTFDSNRAIVRNGQFHFVGNFDRLFSDTRHKNSSPNESQQFTANVLFARLATGNNSPRRRKDCHAHSTEHSRNIA